LKAVPHGTQEPLSRIKKILFTSQEKQQTPTPIQTLQTIQTLIPTMVMEHLNTQHQEDIESMY
jgi:hypothetical protein